MDRKRNLNLALKDEKTTIKHCVRYCLSTFITFKDQTEPLANRYEYKIVLCLWRLTIHPLYRAVFIILIIIDVFILAIAEHEENLDEESYREN